MLHSIIKKQFVLAASEPEAPENWVRQTLGKWRLAHSPALPVAPTPFEEPEGVILGWPVGDPADLGGRWVHISPETIRLDPLGSYAVVYHESGVVASSTAAMPQTLLEEDAVLNNEMGLPEHDRWYPFGLTPYRGVWRLLPNHILQLPTLKVERAGWFAPVAPAVSDRQAVKTVALNLKKQFEALTASAPVMMGLTAGHESRMLLSALRGLENRFETFTIGGKSETQDVRTARALARRFGFSHAVKLPVRDADAEAIWFDTIGRCVAGATMRNAAIKSSIRGDAVFVKGIGGEIARAYYYREGDPPDMHFAPETLLARLKLPMIPPLIKAAEVWLSGAPDRSAYSLLDRLYLENRVGCWAAPQLHGDMGPMAVMWPLNQSSSVNAMLSLSTQAKLSEHLCPMIVEQLWPELLSMPINEAMGVRRFTDWAANKSKGLLQAVKRQFSSV